MKKSELRNIIRESVKELMTEQSTPPLIHAILDSYVSYAGSSPSPINNSCMPNIRSFLHQQFTHQGPSGNYIFNMAGVLPNGSVQPCKYIAIKIDTLQTWIAANPQSNNLANKQCKLEIFNNMLDWAQTHPTIQGISPTWSCI